MVGEPKTDESPSFSVRLHGNVGAHFLVVDRSTDDVADTVELMRQALASHPAVSRLDTRGASADRLSSFGVSTFSFNRNPIEQLERAAERYASSVRLRRPMSFLVEPAKVEYEALLGPPPDVVDVRWDGSIFTAMWPIDDDRHAGGVAVRELFVQTCETAGLRCLSQPPTIASTDLVVAMGSGLKQELVGSTFDPKDSRAFADLVFEGEYTDEQLTDVTFARLATVLHVFYRMQNAATAEQVIEAAAEAVMTAVHRRDLEAANTPRRRLDRRIRTLVSAGRISRAQQALLYLAASEHREARRQLQRATERFVDRRENLGFELFERDLVRINQRLEVSDAPFWTSTADRLADRRSTHQLSAATAVGAVVGGATGAVLTRVVG